MTHSLTQIDATSVRHLLLGCILSIAVSITAFAQPVVRANLQPNDPMARHVEVLVAAGLVDTLIAGQRPLSRSDIARMVEEATQRLPAFRDRLLHASGGFEITALRMRRLNYVEAILEYLTKELRDPAKHVFLAHHRTEIQAIGIDHDPRPMPAATAAGSITATTFPLTDYTAGREFRDGGALALETQHSLQLGSYLHLFAHPRFALNVGGGTADAVDPTPLEAYLKVGWRVLELTLGRDHVQWGPGLHGGLALSDQARGLDLARLSTPIPIALGPLGHFKATVLAAYLHDGVSSPHTMLTGYRVDLLPHRTITVGAQHLVMLGGAGRRDANAGQALLAFAGIPFAGDGLIDTNHTWAFDLAARLPAWRDLRLYMQWFVEDFDRAAARLLDRKSAWLIGIHLPRGTYDGGWSFRAEFTRAGASAFRDAIYTSGWSLAGRPLGAASGPNSHQLEFVATRDNVLGSEMMLTTRLTHRNGAADEWSGAMLAQIDHPISRRVAFQLAGGLEQLWNPNFTAGTHATNGFGALGVAMRY